MTSLATDSVFRLPAEAAITVRFARRLLRSGLRGRTRLTLLLAEYLSSLQVVPVVNSAGYLHLDLRVGSSHGLLAGEFPEIDEQEIMKRCLGTGEVAYDIGAHLGVHTLFMSHLVGPAGTVVAFEPNPEVLSVLETTVDARDNASVLPIAVSDEEGESVLHVPPDASMASLADWTGKRAHRVACRTQRLADVVRDQGLPLPDFVKCDVEGGELAVFRGASSILDSDDGPIVLFEAGVLTSKGFGLGVSAASDYLLGLRKPHYRLYQIGPGGDLLPLDAPHAAHANLLAVPEARRDRLGLEP